MSDDVLKETPAENEERAPAPERVPGDGMYKQVSFLLPKPIWDRFMVGYRNAETKAKEEHAEVAAIGDVVANFFLMGWQVFQAQAMAQAAQKPTTGAIDPNTGEAGPPKKLIVDPSEDAKNVGMSAKELGDKIRSRIVTG